MGPTPRTCGSIENKVMVFDEISRKQVKILEYAWRHGNAAARNKLAELRKLERQGKTEQPQIDTKADKDLVPVEYKGNFLGGKKSVNDTLYKRTRESRSLQNPTTLLFYLIQHSAWDGKVDKHRTYRYWYEEKKLIVATRSQEQMARDLGVSIRTIQRWLDELEEDNLIQRTVEGRENTYVLGKVAGTGKRL